MSAKCRVCHRPLQSADAIAAGIGPICAAKAARRAATNELAQRTAYPAERLERISRNVAKLGRMLANKEQWSPEAYSLIVHWYGRWRMMQIRAQRMAFGQR